MAGAAAEDSSQANYRPSEYEDATWEIIGEVKKEEIFEPLAVKVLPGDVVAVDPMFQNYGGIPAEQTTERWHLPDHLGWESKKSAKTENVDERTIPRSITPLELDALISAATAQGRDQGREEMRLEQGQKISELQARLITLTQDLSKQMEEENTLNKRQAVDLAVQISRKIIEHAVEINPEYILPLIEEAIGLAGSAAIRRIRVSAQDLEFIQFMGVPEKLKSEGSKWSFEADESIRSGCVVDAISGEIDFQLDHAWERVKQNIVKFVK